MQLVVLANGQKVSWLLGDKESHRESFDSGLSPSEELEEQKYAAAN